MKNILLTFTALAATAHVASAAGIISINLITSDGNPAAFPERQVVASGDAAGLPVASAMNWNNANALDKNAASATTITVSNANDDDGVATLADFVFTANGGGSFVNNNNTNTGNNAMMNGYNSLSMFTWADLGTDFTDNGFDIYVYFNSNNDSLTQGLGATVAGSGSTTFGDDGGAFTGTFTRATGTTSANANNSNFFRFEGLTADSGTVNFSGPSRRAINGIQFVAVPEPSTALLGALGLLALLRRRR